MNISNVIKEERKKKSMSQEELAEKIFVSRQTISSWENGKSYPDIHSLILLSQVFGMTIDNLIKGDLEIMEQKIEKSDIRDMNRYAIIMCIGIVLTIILLPLSWYLAFIPGVIASVLLLAVSVFFAYKVDRIKQMYDVQSFREIVAFTKGETLDEISKIRESGKRKYQVAFMTLVLILLGILASLVIWWILQVV
jgi:transcriptional regulator with XRE-family HTH domain